MYVKSPLAANITFVAAHTVNGHYPVEPGLAGYSLIFFLYLF